MMPTSTTNDPRPGSSAGPAATRSGFPPTTSTSSSSSFSRRGLGSKKKETKRPSSTVSVKEGGGGGGKRRFVIGIRLNNYLNLCLYLVYLTSVCIIEIGDYDIDEYELQMVIDYLFLNDRFKKNDEHRTTRDRDKTFQTSHTLNDFWDFTNSVVVENFYKGEGKDNGTTADDTLSEAGVEHDNKLVGRPRLRQLRVSKEPCPVEKAEDKRVRNLTRPCYPPYTLQNEHTRDIPFPKNGTFNSTEGHKYRSEKALHGGRYHGSLGTYSGGGYTVLLPVDKQLTVAILTSLKKELWINRPTRAVFLEFTLFNPNLNIFSFIRLAWEIPATGGVTTSKSIETAKLYQYSFEYLSFSEKFVVGCKVVFFFLTLYYIADECLSFKERGCAGHFTDVWSYVTFVISGCSIYCIVYEVYMYIKLPEMEAKLSTNTHVFVDILDMIRMESAFQFTSAILIFLVWIRLLQFVSALSTSVALLLTTLKKAAVNIGGFGVIFLFVLVAFASMGYLLFSTEVLGFTTFWHSVYTLWRFILGDFEYEELRDSKTVLGPLFFLGYMVSVVMIIVNMFLAIINDSYTIVQDFASHHYEEGKPRWMGMLMYCCPKSVQDLANKRNKIRRFKDIKDIRIQPSELKSYLKTHNFSPVEIEIFLERFNIAEHDVLDGDEAHKLLSDIIYNTYVTKTEEMEAARKEAGGLSEARILTQAQITNLEKAKEIEKFQFELLEQRLGRVEDAVLRLLPTIERFMEDLENDMDTIRW